MLAGYDMTIANSYPKCAHETIVKYYIKIINNAGQF